MKYPRTFVLVLLTVLLPLRGAVAAGMLCPQAEGTRTTNVAAEPVNHGMHADHEMQADLSAAHHHASADASGEETSHAHHPANCHACAGSCCMASMVATVPSLGLPKLTALVTFPALKAPRPAFSSGGQDRPPRTI